MRSVVHQYNTLHFAAQHAQVLHQCLAVDGRAGLSVQSMFYAVIGIKVVQNGVSVALIAGSEDDHIKVSADVFNDFPCVGAYVYVATDCFAMNELEGYF